MDVLVTGSHGFIGSALVSALTAAGHRPVRALRQASVPQGVDGIAWDPQGGTVDRGALEGIGAVVHLAGAGIGDKRWTAARKRVVLESRTRGTGTLAAALASLRKPPTVMVSASAVGYYGHDAGEQLLTEDSPPGDDFVAEVCTRWEQAAAPVARADIRLVTIRSGPVLGAGGGLLQRLVLPFRLGIGGRIGSGEQWTPWISLADEVGSILHALADDQLRDAVNLVAPNPVRNRELVKTLGRVLRRPTVIPTPLLPLKAWYTSDLVETVLLADQRVSSEKLEASGYTFEHPVLEDALRATLG